LFCFVIAGRFRSFGPSHTLDSSILGIKRVCEDHEIYRSDESRILKRKKLMEALGEGEEQRGLWEEAKEKFQWLCPSKIRDNKGRMPEHPLYDKRTLQIPPDVLGKMSASQKQYWATKCQYMDTILFFKVVCFSSVYPFFFFFLPFFLCAGIPFL
jgi:DNA mismatch repair protein MSH6